MAKKIMETKLYIRDGRRFKYVPNMLGMYWNGIILTKEKMQDSIAVVIEQHYDHAVMAFLEVSEPMSWYEAKNWCKDNFYEGRLPSNTELISLKKYITTSTINYIWGEECSDSFAWYLILYSSLPNVFVSTRNKHRGRYVRAIAVRDVPILNLI